MAATMTAIALTSGCGGGGSSSPTMAGDMPTTQSPTTQPPTGQQPTGALPSAQDQPRVAARLDDLAANDPTAGSVTQSSNADSNNITTDRITATPRYDTSGLIVVLEVDVENTVTRQRMASDGTGTNVLFRATGTDDGFGDDLLSMQPTRGILMSRNVPNGRIYVAVGTDRKPPQNGQVDADYMAAGWWMYLPDDAGTDTTVAAFADGGDPFTQGNMAALTDTATYTGQALGIFSTTANGRTGIQLSNGFIELNADFMDGTQLGTIGGRIYEIYDTSTDETVENPDTPRPGNPEVTLSAAPIGSSDSGFFKGDASMMDGGRRLTGRWGGQFYGNGAAATDHPGSVAGTFGVTTSDGSLSYIGSYMADQGGCTHRCPGNR